MKNKIVIALGGNALGSTPEEQLKLVKSTAKKLVDLIDNGNDIIISHGNGPQVGMINTGMEFSSQNGGGTPIIPFPECGAMSQGYIGYHLEQAIINELNLRGINKNCATIITQVEVDEKDDAFNNPTKPIGIFYSKEEADKLALKTGYEFMEDAGRGYRRVVPSPNPIRILEINTIKLLIDNGNIVIAIGGGGIPVLLKDKEYIGTDAVIDKDKTSALLAREIGADTLLILTAVEKVYLNFGKDNQKSLSSMTTKEAKNYLKDNHFASGSMLPKIASCIDFVQNSKDSIAIITSLDKVNEALDGKTGTKIIKE
ncbi:MAG: carbamate kinase [Bacilli bacterium]|nr:carbamate kinase [Bacteroidales bacterium]MDD4187612.1 carbamate kinase [Bacilli bacterium]